MNVEKLTRLAISDNGFIFDPITGHSFTTNEIGIKIINLLKENKENEDILDELAEIYSVNENELDVDLMDFIHNLKNFSLV
ncbi:MAG: PqqD family protein [Candidatus Cloacimonetes bacterium]|jgi:hypothetical protein|nr:PqqD family protein [Candidatus Cloacimonadota bacterium]MBT6994667.1 PqqD family protein [Candidatus Cloacimonadota bacterium]MBT7469112.1 PqqD family protein [Candidatus Cloacimonadota bacterium]